MKSNNFEFLKSALSPKEILTVIDWVKKQNEIVNVSINKVPFKNLQKWYFDEERGNLKHDTGKFFSIDGIRVETTWGSLPTWDQPIINQSEIGFLGFIVKEIDGILHFLVQAKIEPGNVNFVQLSPTLQATRSNYLQTHGGKKPRYLARRLQGGALGLTSNAPDSATDLLYPHARIAERLSLSGSVADDIDVCRRRTASASGCR